MKRKVGIMLMVTGSVLILAALSLFLYNQNQQQRAAESVEAVMPKVVDAINERHFQTTQAPPAALEANIYREMPVMEIDGYDYIGFVSIPSLGLELPVMTDWTYPQLQISPCRYSGSMYTDDLVVMAHNYPKHFGKLFDLRIGDTVTFTDMDAETVQYVVVALDILQPAAIDEMTAGDFDLTLFTCNYGGQSRVTVRCDRIE